MSEKRPNDTGEVSGRDRARAMPATPPPVPADVRLAVLEQHTAALRAHGDQMRLVSSDTRALLAEARAARAEQAEAGRAVVAELAALRAEIARLVGRVSPREAAPVAAPASDLVVSSEVEGEVAVALAEEMAEASLEAAESGARPPGEGLRVTKERELRADPERRRRALERKAWRANPPAPAPSSAPLRNTWKDEHAALEKGATAERAPVGTVDPERFAKLAQEAEAARPVESPVDRARRALRESAGAAS